MNLFEAARFAHILVGVAVLVTFWRAALASKGGLTHRRFGRLYLLAMTVLLALTLTMAAGMAVGGQGMRAVFNVYVALISVASVWMAWRSIADRDNVNAYRGWACKILCAALGCYGVFLLTIVPRMGSPARMAMVLAFAVLGLTIFAALLRRIIRGADHPRWWLSEHLTAMALNFAATHASFTILGLGAILPAVKEPWTRTAILTSWMISAGVVRWWAGRRFMRVPQAADRTIRAGTVSAGISNQTMSGARGTT
jgi:hypothetical protein